MTHLGPVFKGLATYIPGVYHAFGKREPIRANSAEYYYDLWFKHLTWLWHNGMRRLPETLAEFGPGNSLGLGVAALLSGVRHYCAFDVVEHESPAHTMEVFERMVEFFRERRGRFRDNHSPDFDRFLDARRFPSHILTEERLAVSLAPERIEAIRRALVERDGDGPVTVRYVVPWNDPALMAEGSVDVIISHAVMEYVADLEAAYATCGRWLRPGGWMSHQIDLRSHDLTEEWNGNWAYSDTLWKLVVGRRPYFLNRQPCSRHLAAIEDAGFDIVCTLRGWRADGLTRAELAREWQNLSDEDLACAGLFVQARRQGG